MAKQTQSAGNNSRDSRIPTGAVGIPASISTTEIYPLAEFQARTGLSDSAMRAARRRGLPVLRAGKRAFVFGQDFLAFLKSKSNLERSPSERRG